MNPEALARAEKGLAWLKESGPIYGLDVNQVNLEELQLASACKCVLGQLGGTYGSVIRRLYNQGVTTGTLAWTREHGFHDEIQDDVFFEDLDEAWDYLLTQDRKEQS